MVHCVFLEQNTQWWEITTLVLDGIIEKFGLEGTSGSQIVHPPPGHYSPLRKAWGGVSKMKWVLSFCFFPLTLVGEELRCRYWCSIHMLVVLRSRVESQSSFLHPCYTEPFIFIMSGSCASGSQWCLQITWKFTVTCLDWMWSISNVFNCCKYSLLLGTAPWMAYSISAGGRKVHLNSLAWI